MSENPFQAMSDMMKKMQPKMPGAVPGMLDKELMMKSHRQNIETLTEANKMAVEVMKSIATLQSQYIKKTFEDMADMMKCFAKPDASKEGVRGNTEKVRDQVHRTFDHTANISEIIAKTQRDMFDRMCDRYSAGAEEMIDVTKKASRTKH